MERPYTIRPLRRSDSELISAAFTTQGWQKPASQYIDYFRQQEMGKRAVFVAEVDGEFAGYLTVVWQSAYPPFREAGIPEIVDLNVLQKYQRTGVASHLMSVAEDAVSKVSNVVGLGYGITHDYGPAQVMYVRRGYLPDGRGLIYNGKPVQVGQQITVDHDLAIYMVKSLLREEE